MALVKLPLTQSFWRRDETIAVFHLLGDRGFFPDAVTREATLAHDETAEVSEAEIAVHWQEEAYVHPPKTFIAQADLTDKASKRLNGLE